MNDNKEESKIISKSKISIKDIIILQAIIMIYTLSGVAAKEASFFDFSSKGFILFYGVEILILGIYAVLWQQIIKKFDLSVAYANRSIALVWSLLWAVLFFNETINIKNIIGIMIVILGTILVNTDGDR